MNALRINKTEKKIGISASAAGKQERRLLFVLGCILGMLLFIAVYGVRVLDVTYDAWLLNADMDLSQHYIGWCHYRMDPWHFPIGLIDSLSYPTNMSVIYTDSIPLFAFVFKLFARVLPQKFQYFGLFGLLSFALQGGISALLIRKFTDKKWLCIVSSVFFVLSFPVLQRMFYHTALAAQWIILLAMLLWFSQEQFDTTAKKCRVWAGMGILCVSIHSYFLVMAGMVLLASVFEQYFTEKRKGEDKKQRIKKAAAQVISYCAAALFTLFLFGGFHGGTSASGAGLGSFGSNLNTFINSMGEGRVLKELPLYYEFQYEGAGYLGAGILLLLCVAAVLFVIRMIRDRGRYLSAGKVPARIRRYFKEHLRSVIFLILFLVSWICSILPMVTINDTKLFGVPHPALIGKLFGIFRSNGRFIWTAVYLLMICAIVWTDRYLKPRAGKLLLIGALFLQIFDLSGMIKEKQAYFMTVQTYRTMWEDPKIQKAMEGCDQFVFMYNKNDIIMETAYYAYLHNMRLNNFYYARDIDQMVKGDIALWTEELKAGIVRGNVVYIFEEDDFDRTDYTDMDFYYLNGHVIGVKKRPDENMDAKKGQLPF